MGTMLANNPIKEIGLPGQIKKVEPHLKTARMKMIELRRRMHV
jgi:hypothetical protein